MKGEELTAICVIYKRYQEGLKDLPVEMNPWDRENSGPNYWLSCLMIYKDSMCDTERSEKSGFYKRENMPHGTLEALAFYGVEGRPIWKPMHMQLMYRNNGFVTEMGSGRGCSNACAEEEKETDTGKDIFKRKLSLPSDAKMAKAEQDTVIDVIHRCFGAGAD